MNDDEKVQFITRLAEAAANALGVRLLNVTESPLPGGYFVATYWFRNEPYVAIIFISDSRESHFANSVESVKRRMLGAMVEISANRATHPVQVWSRRTP